MRRALAKRTIRLATWVVVLSIVGLTLSSFFPWVSIEEDDHIDGTLHFSKAMMENSNNEQIQNLSGHLDLINLLFWLLIVFGLIFIIGMIIHATGKYPSIAPIMMLIGLENLIVSIFVVVLQIFFLKTVNNMENISLSSIISPIKYAYIPLIFSFVLLVNTIIYTKVLVVPLIRIFKNSKEEQKNIPKQNVDISEKKQEATEKAIAANISPEKRNEMEKWLTGEVQKSDEASMKEKPVEPEEKIEKQIEKPDLMREETPEHNIQKDQLLEEQHKKENALESEKNYTDQTFENAFLSAIEKKKETIEQQKITEENKVEMKKEPEDKKQDNKKAISVICPECNHQFSFELGKDITKIKCPKCGKEGILE